ncbi:MAG: hypothetical protein NW237_11755 [Cyanobacteriota bacterium]|nr:hypothetical protein [Cyanobacteriota bacterium]
MLVQKTISLSEWILYQVTLQKAREKQQEQAEQLQQAQLAKQAHAQAILEMEKIRHQYLMQHALFL